MNRDFITIVSGLPRSGTSLMMQMLQAGGLPVLTDGSRAADEDNPKGYLELEAVKQTRQSKDWLRDAPGKAVKMVHLLLTELPANGYSYRVLLMKRRMTEVIASQRAMLKRQGKPGAALDDAKLGQAFASQMARVGTWLQQQPSFAVLSVDYNELLRQPEPIATAVSDFLGGSVDVARMLGVIDPALYRQRG